MSEPKRYTFEAKEVLDANGMVCFVGVSTLTHPMGKYVAYEDYARLKAEVERLQSIHSIDSIGIEQLKAEVERLTSDIQMEKENEDRLVREWQRANNEVYGLQTQVAALIDDQTRLKAEVERLDNNCDYLDQKLDEEIEKSAMLCGQVERLTKAGDMCDQLLACFEMEGRKGVNIGRDMWREAKKGKSKDEYNGKIKGLDF